MSDEEEDSGREFSPFLIEDYVPTVKHNLYQILPAIWMGSFLSAMDSTVVANIMGAIAADFKQEQYKSWIATSYLLTNTAFQPLYGKVSDIIGRKYALIFAQFTFGFGCFLSIFARDVTEFSIARAISGIGGGGLGAMSSIIVSDIVTLEDRGMYQGYSNLNFAVGQMLGGPLGAFLLHSIGWRWIFGIQVPAVLICIFLAYNYINIGGEKSFTKENLSRIDYGGSITLVASITLFLLLLSTHLNKLFLSIGLVIFSLAFVYTEKYVAKEHIIPLEMVQNLPGIGGVMSFIASFSSSSIVFSLPLFFQIVQNQSTEKSGVYLISTAFSTSIGSLIAGYLLKHSKYPLMPTTHWISFIGIISQTTGLLIIFAVVKLIPIYDEGALWKVAIVMGMFVLGIGYGAILVSMLVMMIGAVGIEAQAVVTGMNYLFKAVGGVLGAGISLSLYEGALLKGVGEVLTNVDQGDKILRKLSENAGYLKTSKLITEELFTEIIQKYKSSVVAAFPPSIILCAISIILGGYLAFTEGRLQKKEINIG